MHPAKLAKMSWAKGSGYVFGTIDLFIDTLQSMTRRISLSFFTIATTGEAHSLAWIGVIIRNYVKNIRNYYD